MGRLFGDEDIEVREEGPGFFRIRVGQVELTYQRRPAAWYVYLGSQEAVQQEVLRGRPVKTHPYWFDDGAMGNIDWSNDRNRVVGIELIGPFDANERTSEQ